MGLGSLAESFLPAQEGDWSLSLGDPCCLFASGISIDNLDSGLLGECLNILPSWEDMVVSKIKNMMITEQSLALDTICHFLEEHNQVGSERLLTGLEIHGAWEEVKAPSRTYPKPSH